MHFASKAARAAADDLSALLRERAALKARVVELEALLTAANNPAAVNTNVNTAVNKRTVYMRDYMRRRRAALKNKNSPSV